MNAQTAVCCASSSLHAIYSITCNSIGDICIALLSTSNFAFTTYIHNTIHSEDIHLRFVALLTVWFANLIARKHSSRLLLRLHCANSLHVPHTPQLPLLLLQNTQRLSLLRSDIPPSLITNSCSLQAYTSSYLAAHSNTNPPPTRRSETNTPQSLSTMKSTTVPLILALATSVVAAAAAVTTPIDNASSIATRDANCDSCFDQYNFCVRVRN